MSDTIFQKFIVSSDNSVNNFGLQKIIKYKDEITKKYENDKKVILSSINLLEDNLNDIYDKENDLENKTKTDINNLSSYKQNKLNEIKNEYENMKNKANSFLDEYEKIINNHTEMYDSKINKINKCIKYVKGIIDNFGIIINNYNVEVKDVEDYSPEDLVELAKKSAEEINYIEEDTNRYSGKKINSNALKFGATSSILATPITAMLGVGSFIKGGLNLKKDLADIENYSNNIVWVYKMLKAQRVHLELTRSETKPKKDSFEEKYKSAIKSAEEYLNISTNELELEINEKISSLNNRLYAIDYSDDINNIENKQKIEQNKLNKINSDYKSSILDLKDMVDEYNENQHPILLNPKYQELSDKKSKLLKELSLYNEYSSIKDFNFTTELPLNTKLNRYWFKLLEKERIYKNRFDELTSTLPTLTPYEEVVSQLRVLDEEIKKLYKVNTSKLYMGNVSTNLIIDEENSCMINSLFYSNLQNKSMLAVYENREDRSKLLSCIKNLIFFLLGDYHPKSVVVYVLDRNQSYDTANFSINLDTIDKKTMKLKKGDDYIKVLSSQKEIDEYITHHKEYINELITKEFHSKDFVELVDERFDKGALIPKFRINIIVDDDLSNELLNYNYDSEKLGVMNILLTDIDNILSISEEEGKVIKKANYNIKKQVSSFGSILEFYKGNYVLTDTDKLKNISFNFDSLTNDKLLEIKDKLRERALNVLNNPNDLKSFIENVVGPPEKWFTYDMEKHIKIYVGYVEGDKSKPIPIVLDELQAPHLAIAGTTGGGKSNVLSVIYNTMKCMYNPTDVNITYIDFKIVEVALHIEPYKSPNASVLSGSQEPEYIKSVMEHLYNSMMERYAYLEKMGFKELSSLRAYQKKLKADKLQEIESVKANIESNGGVFNPNNKELLEKLHILQKEYDEIVVTPREVIILDELTQGLRCKDEEVREKIVFCLTKILELGRANGFHLIPLTQDVSNIPDKMLSLIPHRACTVAPQGEISKTAIGNDFCKRAENQFLGFLGVNSLGGDPAGNIRYVVPYAPESYTPILTKTILEKCSRENIPIRDATVFSENTLYPLDEFEEFLDKNKFKLDGRTFYLGEGAYFTTSKDPHMIKLEKDDRQSVAIISSSKEVRVDFLNKFLLNLKKSDEKVDIIPVFSKEVYPEFDTDEYPVKVFGKALLEPKEALERHRFDDTTGDVVQMFKNDLYPPDYRDMFNGEQAEDYDYANGYEFFNMVEDFTNLNKTAKLKGEPQVPTYFVIFDFEKHIEVLENGSRMFRELARLSNEGNNNNVYLIFVSSNFSKLYSEYCAGYYITCKFTPDDDTAKPFKNQPSDKLYKVVDLKGTYTAVFKPPMYEEPYKI